MLRAAQAAVEHRPQGMWNPDASRSCLERGSAARGVHARSVPRAFSDSAHRRRAVHRDARASNTPMNNTPGPGHSVGKCAPSCRTLGIRTAVHCPPPTSLIPRPMEGWTPRAPSATLTFALQSNTVWGAAAKSLPGAVAVALGFSPATPIISLASQLGPTPKPCLIKPLNYRPTMSVIGTRHPSGKGGGEPRLRKTKKTKTRKPKPPSPYTSQNLNARPSTNIAANSRGF